MIPRLRRQLSSFSAKSVSVLAALILGLVPASAHAQYIPPWLVVAALTPVLVLLLCVILGWLTRSVRTAALHAMFVVLWIVLFGLASYFVENDYVIWTPLALYLLHSALLVVLIFFHIGKRITRSGRTQ